MWSKSTTTVSRLADLRLCLLRLRAAEAARGVSGERKRSGRPRVIAFNLGSPALTLRLGARATSRETETSPRVGRHGGRNPPVGSTRSVLDEAPEVLLVQMPAGNRSTVRCTRSG
jgi:hypothetical protein